MAVAKRVSTARSSAVCSSSPTSSYYKQTNELVGEARPICFRCRNAGVKCGGYIQMQASDLQPKWEFVSKDPAVQYIMPMIAHHKPLLHREN